MDAYINRLLVNNCINTQSSLTSILMTLSHYTSCEHVYIYKYNIAMAEG